MAPTQAVVIWGLRAFGEAQLCQAAVGCVTDICEALGVKVVPYCDAIVLALLECLKNEDLHRQVKPHVLTCFGSIAEQAGPHFDKYLERVLPMLAQASETEVPDRDDGLIEYLNELRETVLEAYTGIVNGLSDGQKANLLDRPNVQHLQARARLRARLSSFASARRRGGG